MCVCVCVCVRVCVCVYDMCVHLICVTEKNTINKKDHTRYSGRSQRVKSHLFLSLSIKHMLQ